MTDRLCRCCRCHAEVWRSQAPLLFNVGWGLRVVCNDCYDGFDHRSIVPTTTPDNVDHHPRHQQSARRRRGS